MKVSIASIIYHMLIMVVQYLFVPSELQGLTVHFKCNVFAMSVLIYLLAVDNKEITDIFIALGCNGTVHNNFKQSLQTIIFFLKKIKFYCLKILNMKEIVICICHALLQCHVQKENVVFILVTILENLLCYKLLWQMQQGGLTHSHD